MNALTLQWHDVGQEKIQKIYEKQPSKNLGTVRIGRDPLRCDIVLSHPTVGYLPLALELVGRYLDTMPDLSLETLLKRLEKKRLEHEAVAKANPLMRYEYGVAEAFVLSWEKLDENAQRLGCWLSLYALADIPFSVEAIEDDNWYKLCIEVAENCLGLEHLDVATSLNNLAVLYRSTGRYGEAEPMYQQALAICERILGVGHPDTITVRGNYAMFLTEAYR